MAIGSLPPVVGETQQYPGQPGRPALKPAPMASLLDLQAEALPAAPAIIPASSLLDALVASVLGHQDGLAAVEASVDLLADQPGLPPALGRALSDLQSLRLGTGGDVTPDALAEAIRRSGAFPASAGTLPDLGGALLALRRELVAWLGAAAPDPAVAASLVNDGRRGGRPPQPPRRGGPLTGQAAVVDTVGWTMEPREIAARLLDQTERALSRLFLHQALGLDDTASRNDGRVTQGNDGSAAAVFEFPLVTPGGTAILQMRIARDDHRGDGRDDDQPRGPSHRVELAADLPPLGRVAARVGLMAGRRVAVGLWCETETGFRLIEAERPVMILALEAAGLTVAGVDLHVGKPPAPDETGPRGPLHRLDLQL